MVVEVPVIGRTDVDTSTWGVSSTPDPQFSQIEVRADQLRILLVRTEADGFESRYGLSPYEDWFRDAMDLRPEQLQVVNAMTDELPTTIDARGIIIGGSSHSVYEGVAWIRRLESFTRAVAYHGIPLLGVCFGHQIIAQAFGGLVEKGSYGRELGIATLTLTDAGLQDPLFHELPKKADLATSHKDAVTRILNKHTRLATGDLYINQSLAFGDRVRTIQPHPEITCQIISKIIAYREEALVQEGFINPGGLDAFLAAVSAKAEEIQANGRRVLHNFKYNLVGPYHEQG